MKTRFCPSPTGNMHIGNMRTALFNYLATKNKGGDFLLRIEDTDKERSKDEYAESIENDLKTLGIIWDEGINMDKGKGPYFQSQRADIYSEYHNNLLSEKKAFYCFCSEEDLEVSRKLQASQGLPPKYNGKCRELSDLDIQENLSNGLKPSLRFKVPQDVTISFTDLVRGEQTFQSNDLSDFIIKKTDGMATFMFANSIDDALMGTSLVMRGEDHLTNTPRQILLLQALNLSIPKYAHISIILGNDRQPLSKRNGSQSIKELLAKGYLPLAINNYLARIGHTYTENNFYSLEELAKYFSIDRLVKSPAVFDIEHLNSWQKHAMQNLSVDEFKKIYVNILENSQIGDSLDMFCENMISNILLPHEITEWLDIFNQEVIDYSQENKVVFDNAGEHFFKTWKEIVRNSKNVNVKEIYKKLNESLNIKGKQVYLPLRVALTGKNSGIELQNIFDLLGKEKIKNRIDMVISSFESNNREEFNVHASL